MYVLYIYIYIYAYSDERYDGEWRWVSEGVQVGLNYFEQKALDVL